MKGPGPSTSPGDTPGPWAGRDRPGRGKQLHAEECDMDWESEAAELAEEEARLEEMKASIDVHALEQDLDAAMHLQDLAQQLSNQETTLARFSLSPLFNDCTPHSCHPFSNLCCGGMSCIMRYAANSWDVEELQAACTY